MHAYLQEEDIRRVAEAVKGCIEKVAVSHRTLV
jgi:hypothetical protein